MFCVRVCVIAQASGYVQNLFVLVRWPHSKTYRYNDVCRYKHRHRCWKKRFRIWLYRFYLAATAINITVKSQRHWCLCYCHSRANVRLGWISTLLIDRNRVHAGRVTYAFNSEGTAALVNLRSTLLRICYCTKSVRGHKCFSVLYACHAAGETDRKSVV